MMAFANIPPAAIRRITSGRGNGADIPLQRPHCCQPGLLLFRRKGKAINRDFAIKWGRDGVGSQANGTDRRIGSGFEQGIYRDVAYNYLAAGRIGQRPDEYLAQITGNVVSGFSADKDRKQFPGSRSFYFCL
jgi:hypothetical protein